VGHRVVHGGTEFVAPVRIDARVLDALERLVPLAPLHQPKSLAAVRAIERMFPGIAQVACFDTAFHRTQPKLARALALPRRFTEQGVERYGFHGLSYEYVASALARLAPGLADARVIAAHLGNGASLCALRAGRSVATTMGFSTIDGLVMGTRPGALDPGVLLYLIDRYGMDARSLERLLYEESGLLGVSELSADMRVLLASAQPRARDAVDLFVYRLGRELGSLAAALGGLDAIVFTGGIGENSAAIRARVCRDAAWLGVALDEVANETGATRISADGAPVSAWIVPSDENLVIARHTARVLGGAPEPGP
jgi:acetate kinase